jgi:RNA polymerase sigma factor (sigma-70 family)
MALLKSKAAKAAATINTADWSIAQLSAIYTEHRTQLVSQARRITKNETDAHEVVQEAFLKFMLAAPDLDSADRAIAYLRTSVTNLALNVIRARGARPNLVAIDSDTTQERLNEIASENHIDVDTSITAAEDAAIIREALSRLTPDQRTALIMWEMEGRTTDEIATALHTNPANVRHILGRARKSMVRILQDWVVDEKSGLTALDALSTTYKKSVQLAQKSSKAALSFLLIISAVFGFNSISGSQSPLAPVVPEVSTTPTASPTTSSSASPTASEKASPKATSKNKPKNSTKKPKSPALSFVGLNKEGIPTGFTITDEKALIGSGRVTKGVSSNGGSGFVITNQFITAADGPTILISQEIEVDGSDVNYSAKRINVGFGGGWRSVQIKSTKTSTEVLANGDYLITATFFTGYLDESDFEIPTGTRGYDLVDAPKSITTRILLDPVKTQVIAQAVQVTNR